MTTSQRLTVRASEIRARLSEIAEIPEMTDEHRSELTTLRTEYRDTEGKLQAAITAEGDAQPVPLGQGGSAEDRAYGDLCGRANIGNIFQALTERRATEGAEAELKTHHGLLPTHVPLDLLRAPVEHRAVTAAPTNTETMQEAPIQPVFATGALAYLGVDMPSVPVGDAVYPVLTTRPSVRGPFVGSDVAAETDGSFDAELLAPERVQASFSYLRTDAARFGMLGESLREALNSGLTEKIDAEGIAGANGLLTGANLANHAAGGTTTFAQYVSRFAFGRVDGRFAATTRDLKALVGSPIFAHMGSVYRANETDTSAVDRLMSVIGMDNIRVSAHVPAVVNKKQNGRHPARDAQGHVYSDVGQVSISFSTRSRARARAKSRSRPSCFSRRRSSAPAVFISRNRRFRKPC